MIKAPAKVISWHAGLVTLAMDSTATCSGCKRGGTCAMTGLSPTAVPASKIIVAPHSAPLQPGESVELMISRRMLLAAAACAYLIPLIGLFAIAGLGQYLFHRETISALSGLLGLVIGHFIAKGGIVFLDRQARCTPTIQQIAGTHSNSIKRNAKLRTSPIRDD